MRVFSLVMFLFLSFGVVFGSSLDDLVDSYDDVIESNSSSSIDVLINEDCSLNIDKIGTFNFAIDDNRFIIDKGMGEILYKQLKDEGSKNYLKRLLIADSKQDKGLINNKNLVTTIEMDGIYNSC